MKRLMNIRLPVLLLLALTLPSCALIWPQKPYMPDKSGIVVGDTVTVGQNENVYSIAHAHNVSMRDIIVLNDLKPPFDVQPGSSLRLPAGGSFAGDMPTPNAAPLGTVEKNELAPIEPAAVSSESLEPVAPAAAHTNPPPLSSYAATSSAPVATLPAQPPEAKPAIAAATQQAEPVQALNRPSPPQKQVATTTADAAPGDTSDMVWPVQGQILSPYGAKDAGLKNDGVNIGAPKGAQVVSAAPGTVVYAGNEMKGFGNLVLIRHQGDWVTAYAHLDRVLVKKDTVVGQGDVIGTVGKTGNVSTPQLHFETRHNGKPVDPAGVVKQ